jgi:hypothetical protein
VRDTVGVSARQADALVLSELELVRKFGRRGVRATEPRTLEVETLK